MRRGDPSAHPASPPPSPPASAPAACSIAASRRAGAGRGGAISTIRSNWRSANQPRGSGSSRTGSIRTISGSHRPCRGELWQPGGTHAEAQRREAVRLHRARVHLCRGEIRHPSHALLQPHTHIDADTVGMRRCCCQQAQQRGSTCGRPPRDHYRQHVGPHGAAGCAGGPRERSWRSCNDGGSSVGYRDRPAWTRKPVAI
eukprot:COSAG06_NODE_6606_length_2857_cov_1.553299_2_plen_200_part_00